MPRWARQVAGRLRSKQCACCSLAVVGRLELLQGEIVDLYIPRKWCVAAQLRSHGPPARRQHGSAGSRPRGA